MSSLKDLSFHSGSTFTFIEEIGRGGMAIVYLAEKHCEGVSDFVVLKTIRYLTEHQVERLKREANIAAALRHENIVRTYGLEAIPFNCLPDEFQKEIITLKKEDKKRDDRAQQFLSHVRMGFPRVGTETSDHPILESEIRYQGKRLFLAVMEFIEGWDLRKIHRKHTRTGLLLPVSLNAFIISRICRALEYAHKYIVHRDISPDNILVNYQGVAKLSDFGIAVAADQEIYELAGKIQYMAPEQVQNDQADNRSDIFALGLVAYYLLTGVNIFAVPRGLKFREQADYYMHLLKNEIVPPHEVCIDIPEVYSRIIMKMLVFKPEDRYQTIGEVGSDIEKKYLYAQGFGPTNNSLEAYMRILETDFKTQTEQELQQLTFLADIDKKYQLKRKIGEKLYTVEGRQLLRNRLKEKDIENWSTFIFTDD